MSDGPSPHVAVDTPVGGAENLNQLDVDRILADFRAWLEALHAFDPSSPDLADGLDAAPVDLATVVGQFVALKQEVNLQTRASRGQMEQNAQALEQFKRSLALMEMQQERLDDGQDEKLRPLLKSLVDSYDALALARREVAKIHESLQLLFEQDGRSRLPGGTSSEPANDSLSAAPRSRLAGGTYQINVSLPWWARWLGLGKRVDQVLASHSSALALELDRRQQQTTALAARIRQGVQSILTGYGMSLQRIERALEQHDLEPIAAVGQPFDPEQMEALEIVRDSGRPAGEVAEEIRRGYLWHGKVFRFAQVRVCQ